MNLGVGACQASAARVQTKDEALGMGEKGAQNTYGRRLVRFSV